MPEELRSYAFGVLEFILPTFSLHHDRRNLDNIFGSAFVMLETVSPTREQTCFDLLKPTDEKGVKKSQDKVMGMENVCSRKWINQMNDRVSPVVGNGEGDALNCVSAIDSDKNCCMTLVIPFESEKEALVVFRSVSVDPEPPRSSAKRELRLVHPNRIHADLVAKDFRSLRASCTSLLDSIKLVCDTIQEFRP
ncbi:unnamed protein product [Notodromas monacha]|uniref:L antigen family member 3 n=1 Tax=Notodromas monacha TaxID=399045 RepID=A0A7R9GE65_9CRUS|nr:unnamed protein product [Notodromas monacha]CAG0917558.1 unnamed protein product [Notodromas monacha]